MADSDSESDYQEPEELPIFDAVSAFDVEALRRELAAGADPNLCKSTVRFLAAELRGVLAECVLRSRFGASRMHIGASGGWCFSRPSYRWTNAVALDCEK